MNQKIAKSRIAHNKSKLRYRNIFGGHFYHEKDSGKNALLVLSSSLFIGLFLSILGNTGNIQADEMISPYVGQLEVPKQAEPTPTPTPTVEQYIKDVFGEEGELMVKIFTCESGLNPETVGDKHLMGMLDGEMIGDSIGIAQIRTGDAGVYDSKPWNRAKANGMTVEEFRTEMKNPYKNIDYAYKIYERQGVGAWHNCANKVR